MIKKLLAAFLGVVLCLASHAQNEVKAKIEFEEAEKAYNSNDFVASLNRLNEAEKLIGKPSSTILYLKILSQNQIINAKPYDDFLIVENIRKNCDAYMKLTEKKTGLYEKYKEVYQIKQDLEKYPKSLVDFTKQKEQNKLAAAKVEQDKIEEKKIKGAFLEDLFEKIHFRFEEGKTVEYYTAKYPEFDEFIKKSKKKKTGDETTYSIKLGVGRVFGKLFRVELDYVVSKNSNITLASYTILAGGKASKENIYDEYDNLVQQALNTYGADAVISKNDQYGRVTTIKSKELNFGCRIIHSFFDFDNTYSLSVAFFVE